MKNSENKGHSAGGKDALSRVGILSLGCPRNLADSEVILARLQRKGYRISDSMAEAEVGIVNTCAFLEDARKESVDAILDLVDLKKSGRLKKIIVYGCLAQRYKGLLSKELPEVDAFIGKISLNHELARYPLTPGHYAYLKICEGCVNRCSYCAIPAIKGRFASVDAQSLIDKARALARDGISELNIIGQDITGYGVDLCGKRKLLELLGGIIRNTKDIHWIRLLYLYPHSILEGLLELMQDSPRICRYIDLPIQHINDRILKLMNRRTTRKEITALIEKIRKKLPGIALRTSVIVGFPSETQREFRQLLDFTRDFKFERLGAFMYSREAGTPASRLKGQIPQHLKTQRFALLMSQQQQISDELNKKFLGKDIEVLIDAEEKDHYLARTEYDAPEVDGAVYLRSRSRLKIGQFVTARVTDTLEYDLVAQA